MEKWLKWGLIIWAILLIPFSIFVAIMGFGIGMGCGLGVKEWYCFNLLIGMSTTRFIISADVIFLGLVLLVSFIIKKFKSE